MPAVTVRVWANPAQPPGQVRHVQGAGHHVEQPDPDEEEGRADRAEDEVAERGEQRRAPGAEGDQGVGRQRRDLEEDEDVECIPGDRHAQHPVRHSSHAV